MDTKTLTYVALACAMTVSCQEKGFETSRRQIGFAVNTTKSIIESTTDMEHAGSTFEVNAAYSAGSTFNPAASTPLMEKRHVVYNDGAWAYSPAEYWMGGNSYAFRAIYPANAVEDLTDNLKDDVSFTFTTAWTQASQVDLMMSDIKTVSTPAKITTMPAVNLRFSHLLCNLRLLVRVAEDSSDEFLITGIQVTGMKDKGTYTNGTWDLSEGMPMVCATNYPEEAGQVGKTDWLSVSGYGLLIIPQEINGNVKVTLNYTVKHNGVVSAKSPTITVPAPASGRWDAGKVYKYHLELNEDYEIRFKAPEVEPWGQEQLGGTIIIK